MKPHIKTILELLQASDFPFPVAIFPDRDWDLGPILSVQAFDVPDGAMLDVSQQICDLLWPVETQPMILTGALYDFASEAHRQALPADTAWYEPRRTPAATR